MARNKKQDERSTLDILRKRRTHLKNQRATQGITTDPSVDMEIEDIDREIAELERSLEDSGGYHLTTLPLLIQRYDPFFERFAENLPSNETDPIKFRKSLLVSLGYALDTEHVFIAHDTGIRWEIEDIAHRDSDSDPVLDSDIQHLIYRAARHYADNQDADPHKYAGITMGVHSGSGRHIIFAPFPDSSPPEVLVLHGVKMESGLDTVIALILDTLIHITKNFTAPQPSLSIQIKLFNALKRSFFYVSEFMYKRQFELFQEQLNKIVMYYEPIISLSYYPYICRWEALARNVETKKVPKDLFETCELWGRRFQIELDVYCLNFAVESYRTLPKRPEKREHPNQKSSIQTAYQSRVGDILPLSVNVYPETLVRTAYRNAILNLAKEKLIPLDKLTLELSEKRPLPTSEESFGEQEEMSWFRDRLTYYTRLGITFAIDDYGIGFASASRLSRLEPAIVKIDRDALLHSRGSYTIQQVLKLEQESMGKMIVVIEGFDDESKLSLAELYQMGIRYVQGHAAIGGTRGTSIPPEEIYRLSPDDEDDMIKKLGLV